ncbi:MAG: hypothetical protein LBL13_09565 [Bacteroidales bacterium]|nr:hypothetical protein [Bacteroidales bacterium]
MKEDEGAKGRKGESNVIKLSHKSSERATSIAHGQRPVSETSPRHY